MLFETDPVLTTVPAWVGVTTRVTVALAVAAMAPRAQVIFEPLTAQVPCDAAAETKVTPFGKESDTVAALAASGPKLVTVRV